MTTDWSADELEALDRADELEIAVRRDDGTLARWTPIWVVRAGTGVYVRTWHRRTTGWYGRAVRTGRARVRVPDLEVDVTVTDLDAMSVELATSIDAAYRDKYGHYGPATVDRMTTEEAADTTLELLRTSP